MSLFPSLDVEIRTFVANEGRDAVDRVRLFLTEKIQQAVAGVDEASQTLKATLEKHGINVQMGPSRDTAHLWMIKSGCKWTKAKVCYYTDNHNREDVVKYRDQ